jgi:glycylpeptide N-tetradecanoyltransferase
LAKDQGFDVFNALTIMDNALFLKQQKFGRGTGLLHYYLSNYRTQFIERGVNEFNEPDEECLSGVGLVML